jgi:hypothetical protein
MGIASASGAPYGSVLLASAWAELPQPGRAAEPPSLIMVSRDLTRVLTDPFPAAPATSTYLDQLRAVTTA